MHSASLVRADYKIRKPPASTCLTSVVSVQQRGRPVLVCTPFSHVYLSHTVYTVACRRQSYIKQHVDKHRALLCEMSLAALNIWTFKQGDQYSSYRLNEEFWLLWGVKRPGWRLYVWTREEESSPMIEVIKRIQTNMPRCLMTRLFFNRWSILADVPFSCATQYKHSSNKQLWLTHWCKQ